MDKKEIELDIVKGWGDVKYVRALDADGDSVLAAPLASEVDVSRLDALREAASATAGTPKAYVVTSAKLDGATMAVGWLALLSDSSGHVLTQLLVTHYSLAADGSLDTASHRDDTASAYVRHFNYGSPSLGTAQGAWTPWRPWGRYEGEGAFMGVATPSTVPPAYASYGRTAYYVAVEPGVYAQFADPYGEAVKLEEGEAALLYGEWMAGGAAWWRKTPLAATAAVASITAAEIAEAFTQSGMG